MQRCFYPLSINVVKLTQASYNSALVAQCSFSAYCTEYIRAVRSWPYSICEYIVLTCLYSSLALSSQY